MITKKYSTLEMQQKKQSQWCPHWVPDESVCVRHVNMELHFYQNNDFERYAHKLYSQKVANYSMASHKTNGKHYVACYSCGVKGQPSFVRIYEFPKFEGLALANKSFYKADEVNFKWNPKGFTKIILKFLYFHFNYFYLYHYKWV